MNIGQKIARLREIRGIKQADLARRLGITQQALSKMENCEVVDDERLERVASALEVSPDVIRNFREDVIINNVYDQNNTVINYQFNPIEKIVALYDQLLATERKRIELLETLLKIEQEKKH
ncbi:helix-turn-helix domain-containing protein [Chitinophaga eiseniae]|uniref:Helix-turn-helix transcriptional regulator n=1 Tax=Chitinophaga eiseniae TaxID=634771 RepID=A0A847SDK7_9BACT|nr:helix-turn-helix transcriptional regulator [Chitinophaga eiseniae]NLR77035.1 helix-turn-helix transcriptional regulator [Chitinophaga eiseniae]